MPDGGQNGACRADRRHRGRRRAARLRSGRRAPTTVPRFEHLTAANVTRILQQAVVAARASSAPATIAVVDRVGNVLAVYKMNGAPRDHRGERRARRSKPPRGLVGFPFPPNSFLAAPIAKAITGAYLSSGGNAFTTRTASQIIQENFNPRHAAAWRAGRCSACSSASCPARICPSASHQQHDRPA